MSHGSQAITADPAVRVPIVLRKARNAVLTLDFVDENGTDIPIGEDDFENDTFVARIKTNDKALTNILELSVGNGLEIVDGDIQLTFTEVNSDIDQFKCFFELINTYRGQSWYATPIYFNTGEPIEGTTSEVQTSINLGPNVILATITIAGSGVDFNNMTYEQFIDFYVLMIPFIGVSALYASLLPLIQGGTSDSELLAELYQNLLEFINGAPDDGSDEYYIYTQLLLLINNGQ